MHCSWKFKLSVHKLSYSNILPCLSFIVFQIHEKEKEGKERGGIWLVRKRHELIKKKKKSLLNALTEGNWTHANKSKTTVCNLSQCTELLRAVDTAIFLIIVRLISLSCVLSQIVLISSEQKKKKNNKKHAFFALAIFYIHLCHLYFGHNITKLSDAENIRREFLALICCSWKIKLSVNKSSYSNIWPFLSFILSQIHGKEKERKEIGVIWLVRKRPKLLKKKEKKAEK